MTSNKHSVDSNPRRSRSPGLIIVGTLILVVLVSISGSLLFAQQNHIGPFGTSPTMIPTSTSAPPANVPIPQDASIPQSASIMSRQHKQTYSLLLLAQRLLCREI
jgi:hypothetical protein